VEPGSAAAQAGLRASRVGRDGSVVPGDVIQSIDGQPVDGAAGLDRLLDGRNIGDRLTLGLWREGKTLTVSLTLGAPKR